MSLEKQRHHYVPQFWLRRFRDARNQLHQWDGLRCKVASTQNIMQEPWLNTTFDDKWQPSNQLEDDLSELEGLAASFFVKLDDASVPLAEEHRLLLCEVLALQACRHPDVFSGGHRKAHKLLELLAEAPLIDSESEFAAKATALGMERAEAVAAYSLLRTADPDVLDQVAQRGKAMSPQDPQLPMTDALHAMVPVSQGLRRMSYEIIAAPTGDAFVLGDTPMPQSDLGKGFIVPLSRNLAVLAKPTTTTPTISRRNASPQEVADSNRKQWEMAAEIVVGPDPTQLAALGPR